MGEEQTRNTRDTSATGLLVVEADGTAPRSTYHAVDVSRGPQRTGGAAKKRMLTGTPGGFRVHVHNHIGQ